MAIPTPTTNPNLPYSVESFETLSEGLDYAARGETGCNFYSSRGELVQTLTHAELRERAITLAPRLVRAGLPQGARVAIIADTSPEFLTFFFACQYAGLVPVPLPLPMNLGGSEAYVGRLRRMIEAAAAAAAVAPPDMVHFLRQATAGLHLAMVGTPEEFHALPAQGGQLRPFGKDDLCYIQYSSGSTRFPRGVAISQRSMTSNTRAIAVHGLKIRPDDRCTSWLPLYHDMGLVGFCLTPILTQRSLDYIATADFARRPLLWLKIMSENGGTITFSPTFGYDICCRRASNGIGSSFDLSSWRVAGIGGEVIREDILRRFTETFSPSGFQAKVFVPSYGLAESTLAAAFASLDEDVTLDRVDKHRYSLNHEAVPPKGNGSTDPADTLTFVVCGKPMPGHGMEIRDDDGKALPDRRVGRVFLKGPSLMAGYFDDPQATARAVSEDGWLDTGDLGYMVNGSLVISGRAKDLIICNGRNIWPQDIECAVEGISRLRRGDVAAFSVPADDGAETVVVIVQCRLTKVEERKALKREIAAIVRTTAGVDSNIVLAPSRSLPHTSSGKLSRSWAKANFLSGMYAPPPVARDVAPPRPAVAVHAEAERAAPVGD